MTVPAELAALHRENAARLKERIADVAQLGSAVPSVSPEVALLLVDLWSELHACVLELELNT